MIPTTRPARQPWPRSRTLQAAANPADARLRLHAARRDDAATCVTLAGSVRLL